MKRRTFLLGATALAAMPASARPDAGVPIARFRPFAAYGTRRLFDVPPGPVPLVRVRRADGVEADICAGPDGGLDTAALLAFAGAGSAWGVFVDQVGGRG